MVFPGYQSPPSPPPNLLDLHPVEALLALLLISAAALLKLVANPPRPLRRQSPSIAPRSQFADLFQAAGFKQVSTTISSSPMPPASFSVLLSDLVSDLAEKSTESALAASQTRAAIATAVRETIKQLRQPQASAAPAHGIAPGVTVAELRTMARQQGLAQVGGRPIHKARKADLLAALDA